METTGTERIIDEKTSKIRESASTKTARSVPKSSMIETDITTKSSEKKRKAPKVPAKAADNFGYDHLDEAERHSAIDEENNIQLDSNQDQVAPVKSKKKRAPKVETINDNNETITMEEPKEKKKSKAPKTVRIEDDSQQASETLPSSIDALDSTIETKPKQKKSKKNKLEAQKISDSFENLQVTNLDDTYPTYTESHDTVPIVDAEQSQYLAQQIDNNTSEYEQNILNSYNELANNVSFSEYLGDDQWYTMHLPKSARAEPKSRIRKILPGNHNKDEKPVKKTTGPKGNILNRIRAGVSTLVNDENNLIFGEHAKYDTFDYDEEEDDVDTDNLNRYAQQLRELEDQDREINPEYLVIRDGKTVYGVHEADTDGKVKLSSRKPIYDRFADQTADPQTEKKKLLARIKNSFTRNKDKDGKETKSANGTPNAGLNRKTLDIDVTTIET